MPDPNKLAKQREVGFKILPTCGICKHSFFRSGHHFGLCLKFTYKHEKHAGTKHMGVHQSGWCASFDCHESSEEALTQAKFPLSSMFPDKDYEVTCG